MGSSVFRAAAALAVIAVVALQAAPGAGAIPPPVIPSGPPVHGSVGPLEPTEQAEVCRNLTVDPNAEPGGESYAAGMLNLKRAWDYSKGAGQTVAVIDTGVSRVPRLPNLVGAGDYVHPGDKPDLGGTEDCDAHGTLVAGIIAGAPSPEDRFSGVAPQATVLSIRQTSLKFKAVNGNSGGSHPNNRGYGNVTTMAYAVTRAVDLGATVINISEAACVSDPSQLQDDDLGRAVRDAYERNVVVVVAAGDAQDRGQCAQNEVTDLNRPIGDTWGEMKTVTSPGWFVPYVLTVGSVGAQGQPSAFSLRGPWVSVAAPGESITSLDPNRDGLVNAYQTDKNSGPIQGTSFSAAYVSGVVALVRSAHPELSAAEVIDRVKSTARLIGDRPNIATGFGLVDPVGAITGEKGAPLKKAQTQAAPAEKKMNPVHLTIALVIGLGTMSVIGGVIAFVVLRRKSD